MKRQYYKPQTTTIQTQQPQLLSASDGSTVVDADGKKYEVTDEKESTSGGRAKDHSDASTWNTDGFY